MKMTDEEVESHFKQLFAGKTTLETSGKDVKLHSKRVYLFSHFFAGSGSGFTIARRVKAEVERIKKIRSGEMADEVKGSLE